jgi:signal transduction histidine kinase
LLVICHTTPMFEKESARDRPRIAVAVGLTLTALVAALMFTQIRARLRQQDIAAELHAACEDLQQVQNERERLSRDLHDGAIQSLYGLQLSLGQYEHLLARNPDAARDLLARCRTAADALIAELRTFLVQHLPGEDDPERATNASAALQQLVHRFQSASSVPIELVLKDSPPTPITLGQQMHLRRIAQEAISNSLRHGQPRHVKVELQRHNHHLWLIVADDGVGFDTARTHSGQGLANMQARAIQLGGNLKVESRSGHGTHVTIELPVELESRIYHGQIA